MEEALVQTPAWALSNPYTAAVAFVLAVLAAGRITRLVIYDAYPPSIWLRLQWDRLTDTPDQRTGLHAWNKLLHCPWCFLPWVMLAIIAGFILTFVATWWAWVWWVGIVWMAGAYVGTMIYLRDEPADS